MTVENIPAADHPLSVAQARVLSVLDAAGSPLAMAALRERTGLHENTLRGHLAALVEGGRVSRVPLPRAGRGRPAWGYVARQPEYEALAIALAEALDEPGAGADPSSTAVRGGRAWGARLVERLDVGPGREAGRRLVDALEHTGFAPERRGDTIRLTRCPLLEAARAHPSVVCAVHLGLVEEVLGEPGARLEPFAEPDACLVRLP